MAEKTMRLRDEAAMRMKPDWVMHGRDMLLLCDLVEARLDENATLRARIGELEQAVTKARDTFRHYGDLHAAKPDEVKAKRNYDLADEMQRALSSEREG